MSLLLGEIQFNIWNSISMLVNTMVFKLVLVTVLAILTQQLVSWVGSRMEELGNSNHYAYFTFSDDRNMSMSVNILMNICIPNIVMIFIYMITYKLGYDLEFGFLRFYVLAYYLWRMFLICVLLGRREFYNLVYEVVVGAVGCVLAYGLVEFFLKSEGTIFLTADELRTELWFVILVIVYQFFKQLVDKKVTQQTVLPGNKVDEYIQKKFDVFYQRYGAYVCKEAGKGKLYMLLFTIMIFENYNRSSFVRGLEYVKFLVSRKASLGIMQVTTTKFISNRESIDMALELLEQYLCEYMGEDWTGFGDDDLSVFDVALQYNPDIRYAQAVVYIYRRINGYVLQNVEYEKVFLEG